MRVVATRAGVLLAAICAVSPAGAATVRVDCEKQRLQPALNASAPGSTILVKGTCEAITIAKSVTIDGDPKATIDGRDTRRAVTITGAPSVRLLDLTITGGRVVGAPSTGGAILHPGGALTLRRVSVTGNEAIGTVPDDSPVNAFGGAIHSNGGSLTILGSSIRGNSARATSPTSSGAVGGAIYRVGALRLERTTLGGNRAVADSHGSPAAAGGGIFLAEGALTLKSSHVDGNRALARNAVSSVTVASARGGGITVEDGLRISIVRTTLNGNRVAAYGPGNAVAWGGGLAVVAEQPAVVIRSSLAGNEVLSESVNSDATSLGAGVHWEGSRLTLQRSRVVGSLLEAKAADDPIAEGGGLRVQNVNLRVLSSRVSGNRGRSISSVSSPEAAWGSGGGLHFDVGVLEIRSSTFDRNSVVAEGGAGTVAQAGGLLARGELQMNGSAVTRNLASSESAYGAGLVVTGSGPASISNSTIAENRGASTGTEGGGGGLIAGVGQLTLTSVTVARNSAAHAGGLLVEGGTTTLRQTIVAANTAGTRPDCFGVVASAGYNLVGKTAGCTFVPQPTDRTNTPSRLGALGPHGGPTETVLPRAASPAVDAAPRAACATARDQRGVQRPQGRRCDIGAVERRPGSRP